MDTPDKPILLQKVLGAKSPSKVVDHEGDDGIFDLKIKTDDLNSTVEELRKTNPNMKESEIQLEKTQGDFSRDEEQPPLMENDDLDRSGTLDMSGTLDQEKSLGGGGGGLSR